MLYTLEHFVKVVKEEPEEEFFSQESRPLTPNAEENTAEEEQESRGMGYDVNNDNEPVPENVPEAAPARSTANTGCVFTKHPDLV
eukprot:7614164-Ditylum_brightwellii.AAC.1